jgi:hypothetical protein
MTQEVPDLPPHLWEQVCTVVEAWHGKEVFDLYRDHSPEMKAIKAGIETLTQAVADAQSLRERCAFLERKLDEAMRQGAQHG